MLMRSSQGFARWLAEVLIQFDLAKKEGGRLAAFREMGLSSARSV